MPEGMRDAIAEAAGRNGRSMNAEVIARLQASFEQPNDDDAGAIHEQFLGLRDTVADLQERLERYAARNQEREALYDRLAGLLEDVDTDGKVSVNPARSDASGA
jgi:hypothetical protein